MKNISDAFEVSRSNLYESHEEKSLKATKRVNPSSTPDARAMELLKEIVSKRPSYGYRRACAVLNRKLDETEEPRVNHKRVYRLMKENKMLLPKFKGFKPERMHEGKVTTLRSNTRWCSDAFQIRCWDGFKIETVFVMDTCDREILSVVATIGHLDATDAADVAALAFEKRFPGTAEPATEIEWLTDNGGIFIAESTKKLAESLGLTPCQTPAYSPESNGMSESFVKRFKQDYVYVNELWKAEEVLENIGEWVEDYNENHPHKGLGMLSPKQFLRNQSNTDQSVRS